MAFENVTQQIGQMPQLALQSKVAALQEAARRQQLSRMDQKQFTDALMGMLEIGEENARREEDVQFRDDQFSAQQSQLDKENEFRERQLDMMGNKLGAQIEAWGAANGLQDAQTQRILGMLGLEKQAMEADIAAQQAQTERNRLMLPGDVRLQGAQEENLEARTGEIGAASARADKQVDASVALSEAQAANVAFQTHQGQLHSLLDYQAKKLGVDRSEIENEWLATLPERDRRDYLLAKKQVDTASEVSRGNLQVSRGRLTLEGEQFKQRMDLENRKLELASDELQFAMNQGGAAAEAALSESRAEFSGKAQKLEKDLLMLAEGKVPENSMFNFGGETMPVSDEARNFFRAQAVKAGELRQQMATATDPPGLYAQILSETQAFQADAAPQGGDGGVSEIDALGDSYTTPAEE